ncbi:hypothetical protein EU803_10270 [Loktanella sp. IMCC34160]|uniref:hypothetical protein n=1 Tax=Loktanella sp. IMCC34160 TaxID=2510646 RepID=UPI00101C579C|nr:hypothetical protein [Loktanella sp. IMCC34160]RYG91467.1 hypothetical protein EU803_10270 [Loktanella sp. IMCC34160]
MNVRIAQIRGLQHLTELQLRAEEAKFAELKLREAEIRRLLADLKSERAGRMAAVGQAPDLAFAAGADVRWLRWVDQRRSALNSELAQLLAAQDTMREALRRAFGRDQATKALLEQEEKARAQIRARRANWD